MHEDVTLTGSSRKRSCVPHSVQGNPETILEVKRIMHEHAKGLPALNESNVSNVNTNEKDKDFRELGGKNKAAGGQKSRGK